MESKLFTIILITTLYFSTVLSGCTPDNPQPNTPATSPANTNLTVKSNATFNGISDSFVGSYINNISTSNYMNNPGECTGIYNFVQMSKGTVPGESPSPFGYNSNLTISFSPSLSVGSFNISSSTGSGKALTISTDMGAFTSLFYNSNITLNITAFPSEIGGLIKGDFSGVIGTSALDPNCSTYPLSGSFEAIRNL